jgi:aspartate/methionine/tyrosine aminotransferase
MKGSDYLTWAKKYHHCAAYNLASSGVTRPAEYELSLGKDVLDLSGDHEEGWAPFIEQVARRYGVSVENVVPAPSASMANHLVCALLLEPGDEVLVEHPVYEPLHALPRFFHAEVRFFDRRREDAHALDMSILDSCLTERTRLVICSNLHNPTARLAPRSELERLAESAEANDFHVLIDEVYLEWLIDEGEQTAARLGPRMVTTSSLTKAFGLDALRAGWILADAEIAERLRRMIDLFYVKMPLPIERMAAHAVGQAPALLAPLKDQIAANKILVADFITSRADISWNPPDAGPVAFVELKKGSVDTLETRLRAADTLIAPGRFFGVPNSFRLGFGMKEEILREGLLRLDAALDKLT